MIDKPVSGVLGTTARVMLPTAGPLTAVIVTEPRLTPLAVTVPESTVAIERSEENHRILPWKGLAFGERKNEALTVKLRVCPIGMAGFVVLMESRRGPACASREAGSTAKQNAAARTAKFRLPT